MWAGVTVSSGPRASRSRKSWSRRTPDEFQSRPEQACPVEGLLPVRRGGGRHLGQVLGVELEPLLGGHVIRVRIEAQELKAQPGEFPGVRQQFFGDVVVVRIHGHDATCRRAAVRFGDAVLTRSWRGRHGISRVTVQNRPTAPIARLAAIRTYWTRRGRSRCRSA